ncbi:MAG TPA: glycine cleavage system protein GcvH [Candidatus Deferrimicrobium sp.]|nr:glycine cleavage system protein GcvH [Candidatus Deferrimicrobium sp.]
MNIPSGLKYTKEHEWIKIEGRLATVGITDYAQGELGDVVFVELPRVGEVVKQMAPFGTIEAVKAVSDLFSPVSGTVVGVNLALDNDPAAVNRDPYGDGWMVKIELSNAAEVGQLLDAAGYQSLVGL